MSHDAWLELAEIYAVGALDGQELARFEGHLSGCPLCEEKLRETSDALLALAGALPKPELPKALKASILEQLDSETATVVDFSRQRRFGWSLAAGLALAGALIGINWNNAAVQRNLMRLEGVVMMTQSQAKRVELKGLEASPQAKGEIVWNTQECSGVFFATGLTPLPEGKVYELWAIADGKPAAAGIFTVDSSGRGVLRCSAEKLKNFSQFAVTMEPAGGLPAPSGAMHLVGSLSL